MTVNIIRGMQDDLAIYVDFAGHEQQLQGMYNIEKHYINKR